MEDRNSDKIVRKPPPRPPSPHLAKDRGGSPRARVPPRRQPSSPITTQGITTSGKGSPGHVNKPLSNKPPPLTRAESWNQAAATRTHDSPSSGARSLLDLSPRIIMKVIKEKKSNLLAKTKSQNSSDGPTTQSGFSPSVHHNMMQPTQSSRPLFTCNSTSTTHHPRAPTEQTQSREREPTPTRTITSTSLHELAAETTEASTTTSPHIQYLKGQRSGPPAPPPKPRKKDKSREGPIYEVIKPHHTSTSSTVVVNEDYDPIPYAVHRPSAVDDDGNSDEYVDMNVFKNKDSKQSNKDVDGIDDGTYVYINPWKNKTPTHSVKLVNNSKVTTEGGYTGLKKHGGEDTDVYTDLRSNTLTDSHAHKTTPLGSTPPTQLKKLTTESGYITSSLKTQLNNDGDGEDDMYTDIIINSGTEHKAAAHQQLQSSENNEMYVNFTQLKASKNTP